MGSRNSLGVVTRLGHATLGAGLSGKASSRLVTFQNKQYLCLQTRTLFVSEKFLFLGPQGTTYTGSGPGQVSSVSPLLTCLLTCKGNMIGVTS